MTKKKKTLLKFVGTTREVLGAYIKTFDQRCHPERLSSFC